MRYSKHLHFIGVHPNGLSFVHLLYGLLSGCWVRVWSSCTYTCIISSPSSAYICLSSDRLIGNPYSSIGQDADPGGLESNHRNYIPSQCHKVYVNRKIRCLPLRRPVLSYEQNIISTTCTITIYTFKNE